MRAGWSKVSLGEVARIDRKGVRPNEIPTGTKYVGLEHIERGGRLVGFETIGKVHVASTKFTFTRDHVLYGKLRPNLGKIARPNFSGVCSTDILPILPSEHLDRDYLAHYLSQQRMIDFAASRATGANLPRLSPSELARFPVPLPSLAEQRRIAAILDRADTLRAKRRKTLSLFDDLIASRFKQISGREDTKLKPLKEVASFYAGNSLPDGVSFDGQLAGYLLLKVSDMNASGNERELKRSALWTAQRGSRSATVPAGAVVIPKRGGAIGTNKKRIVLRPAILDPNLMGIVPIVDAVSLDWLFAWLQSLDLNELVSGSSVPQLNKKDLAPLFVPVPSEKGRNEFDAFRRSVAGISDTAAVSLRHSEELFRSLQARAFGGQL